MKLRMKLGCCTMALITSVYVCGNNKILPQLGKSPLKDVIAAMTLDEKINIVRGEGMKVSNGDNGPVAGFVSGIVPGAAGRTYGIPRLGVPSIIVADGPAGLRIDSMRTGAHRYYCTAFPIGTSIASSWNAPLAMAVGKAMGNEVLEYGVDVQLAPGMNIQRNPLCGRNFEYYSEDPLVAGKMAAAVVNGIQSNGVGTSIKHFAANNQETNRFFINELISQRALREIYLKSFEIAVKEAHPWTVMSSYNKINGTYSSENYDLLNTILRKEWGFNGLVMTDWFAGRDYVQQIRAGDDLLMPGRPAEAVKIKEAIENKTLSEAVLDERVENVLKLILRSKTFHQYKYSNRPDLKGHAAVARKAGTEGIILLKNNSALPLTGKKIALFGDNSYDVIVGGTGSGEVYKAYSVNLYQGLNSAGYQIDNGLKDIYGNYIANEKKLMPQRKEILQTIKLVPEMPVDSDELLKKAEVSDEAVISIGRCAGEGSDRTLDGDYYLTPAELSLIDKVSGAYHARGKKVVVVLNIDGVIDVMKWRDKVDGILLAWLPGQEAGNSMADIMSGKVCPSGHLAITFPREYSDVPSSKTFPGEPSDRPRVSKYDEGIYVGYRYYNTYHVAPAYEFGYGLSYTHFAYNNMQIKKTGDKVDISVEVENTGKVSGKEVVQVYVSAPKGTLDKPEEELRAFAKTRLLKAGEKQIMHFSLTPYDVASFDTKHSEWIADAGAYKVKIGDSSRDIKLTKSFSFPKEIMVKKVNDVLMSKE